MTTLEQYGLFMFIVFLISLKYSDHSDIQITSYRISRQYNEIMECTGWNLFAYLGFPYCREESRILRGWDEIARSDRATNGLCWICHGLLHRWECRSTYIAHSFRLLTSETNEPDLTIPTQESKATVAGWSFLDRYIITGHENGAVSQWDAKVLSPLKSRLIPDRRTSRTGTRTSNAHHRPSILPRQNLFHHRLKR